MMLSSSGHGSRPLEEGVVGEHRPDHIVASSSEFDGSLAPRDEGVVRTRRFAAYANRTRETSSEPSNKAASAIPRTERIKLLKQLRKDPSLRFTEDGRKLLRTLESALCSNVDWDGIIAHAPKHCIPNIAELARQYSQDWKRIADLLAQRANAEPSAR